jgi:soluble lytic murein transglycosylase
MMKRRIPPILAAVMAMSALPGIAADPDVRTQFRAALERAERSTEATQADSAALRAYLLYPDLQGARLLARLRRAPEPALDRQIAAWLQTHAAVPVAGELRRAWLLSLAERRLWPEFLARYSPDSREPALVCHYWQARIDTETDGAALVAPLRDFWQDAPQMPQACVAPFDWLKAQGGQTPEATERRARKALDSGNAGLASFLIRGLPEDRAAPLRQWAQLIKDPVTALEALAADASAGFEFDAVRAAFARLSPRSPERAATLLRRFDRKRFTPEQYAELVRWVALGLSWDRQAAATEWFEALPESFADERVQEWRVRAALWQQRYDLASMWLHAMPPAMAAEPRWAYWRARSLELLGRERQSQPIFAQLAQNNGYYSLLSAWRLGQRYQPTMRDFVDDLIVQSELLELRGIQRARELLLAERDAWADLEWRAAVRDLEPPLRIQAARLASSWDWHIQAVTTLAGLDIHDMVELSYPDPYGALIRHHTRKIGVGDDLVYGVMRQESLFNPRAASPANAYGLLQLLLPTAREVARRNGLGQPARADLLRPDVNIPLGASFLRELHARFDGQWLPALASYNAGPNAARRWLPEKPLEPDIWIENIPYNETRGYIQRVLWHTTVYRWRQTGEPQEPAALLQPVRKP